MKTAKALAILFILAACLGCGSKPSGADSAGAAPSATPEGEYSGKGTFAASAGSMDITATLSLKADKTYELNIVELKALGHEAGTWEQNGTQITLTPKPLEAKSVVMRAMSSAKKPHTVTVNAENTEIVWSDGPMQIQFARK